MILRMIKRWLWKCGSLGNWKIISYLNVFHELGSFFKTVIFCKALRKKVMGLFYEINAYFSDKNTVFRTLDQYLR